MGLPSVVSFFINLLPSLLRITIHRTRHSSTLLNLVSSMSFLKFLVPNVPRSVLRQAGLGSRRQTIATKPSWPPTRIRFNSTQPHLPKPNNSLTGRLKDLSKRYGRAAIVVYLGISAIDFAIAFAAVHSLGAQRIGAYEDKFFRIVKDWTGYKKTTVNQVQQASEEVVQDTASQAKDTAGIGKGSLWTEAVIAYGIHKALFIFIRIPITVAITPPIVKALVRRGWKIGPAAAAAQATKSIK